MKSAIKFLLICVLLVVVSSAYAEEKIFGSAVLQPGEGKTFTVNANTSTKAGFKTKLSIEEAQKCEHFGISMSASSLGEMASSSPIGMSNELTPIKGVIDFTLKNKEKFPIAVDVYTE